MASKQAEKQAAESTQDQTDNTPATQEQEAQPTQQPAQRPAPQQSTVTEVRFAGDTGNTSEHATSAATDGKTTDENKPDGKFLTQEQVDAIIKERIQRLEKKYADYDELKAKATEADDAKRTDEEKRQAELKQLREEREKLSTANQKLLTENSIMSAAAALGLPAEAAYRLADLDKAEFDDNGRITNADALVKTVAEAYPGLVRRGGNGGSVANPGRQEQPTAKSDSQRRAEYFGGGAGAMWQGGGVRMPYDNGEN